MQQGGTTWFFITVDYAYGLSLESDARGIIESSGGKVIGDVKHPFNTTDFGAFVVQAQASGAKVVGLANVTTDMINTVKAANDFGISAKQKIVPLDMYEVYLQELGLKTAQGIQFATTFYWDYDGATQTFAERFAKRNHGAMPTPQQVNAYTAVRHYLKAVQGAGTDGATAVMAKMKSIPVDDFMTKSGSIGADGRYIRDVAVVEAKSPAESKSKWDDLKIVAMIPGSESFHPVGASGCKLDPS